MNQPLPLSDAGHVTLEQWRTATATNPDDVEPVLEVLIAIETNGWPPRWPCEEDRFEPGQWIIARTDNLWVVVRPDNDSFHFITAINPSPDQQQHVSWLIDPEPDD